VVFVGEDIAHFLGVVQKFLVSQLFSGGSSDNSALDIDADT
jgi:hypothetical protein